MSSGGYFMSIEDMFGDTDQLLVQLKDICSVVTDETYDDCVQQGYTILIRLYELGLTQEQVYQPLIQYYNGLEDGISHDCIADIMDFVVGWCSPQWHIWRDNG